MEARIRLALLAKTIISGVAKTVEFGKPQCRLAAASAYTVLWVIALQLIGNSSAFAQSRVLSHWNTFTGGRLATQVDSSGYPLTGGLQEFQPFVYPAFLAIRGADFFIADSGARKIYRFDQEQQILSVVPGIGASMGTRLQVGLDQTLFVLGAGEPGILHFDRAGRLLASYSDPQDTAILEEFTVNEQSGRVLATDRKSRKLIAVDSGWLKYPLIGSGDSMTMRLGALASAEGSVYAIDKNCSCIVILDEEGNLRERIGQGVLAQPYALAAAQNGYLFVADAVNRKLWVGLRGEWVTSYEARKLHVSEISAMAVAEGALYIADGPGGQVVSFRIRPPSERRQ
ncbi:MAG: hypothetical protein OEV35_00515 [Gallionellaceae bacterium]|nr:hypothetical protein [Gallionellaceae bacterium]